MRILKVIMVAYQRVIPLRIAIDSFLVQTDPNWELHIIHDGPAPDEVRQVVSDRKDHRIHWRETPSRNGLWGHPNRALMLQAIKTDPDDFILITNDDNYYVPIYVHEVRRMFMNNVGMIYYKALHNYWSYAVHNSYPRENGIDMGSFVVRAEIAKQVGFRHVHASADGRYCEECLDQCKATGRVAMPIADIVLFVHN